MNIFTTNQESPLKFSYCYQFSTWVWSHRIRSIRFFFVKMCHACVKWSIVHSANFRQCSFFWQLLASGNDVPIPIGPFKIRPQIRTVCTRTCSGLTFYPHAATQIFLHFFILGGPILWECPFQSSSRRRPLIWRA